MNKRLVISCLAFFAAFFMAVQSPIFARHENNLIFNIEEVDGLMVSKTVYKKDGVSLSNFMKYIYEYDEQNRLVTSESLKWSNKSKNWEKNLATSYTYQGKTITTKSYSWDNKKAEYILEPSMSVTMDNPDL